MSKEQWLEERRHSIGASEVASVVGMNPWQSPLQLYLRKRGELPDKEETEAMRLGHKLEPVVDILYREETGRETHDLGAYTIQHNKQIPFLHATLDRRIMPCDNHEKPGDLQIKTVGAHMAHGWEDGAPLYVQAQVQAELAVTGMDWGSVAALIGGQRFIWMDVERNNKFIDFLVVKCEAFWGRIQRGDPPDAQASDTEALKLLYPQHVDGKAIELPQEACGLSDAITALEMELAFIEETRKRYRNQIKQMLGDAERGILPDGSDPWKWASNEVKEHMVKAYTRRTLRRLKA